jgi:hypothetical protein
MESKTYSNQKATGDADAIEKFRRTHQQISVETVRVLRQRGLLHFDCDGYWRLGDDNNGTTRRLDGSKWKRGDNSGLDWHRLIGLRDVIRNDHPNVVFVLEGGKDAVAAAEIANRCGILPNTGIVCALGSGYRPIASEIEQLRGRRILLIGDNDAAGIETTRIVSRALEGAGVDHRVWDWSDCPHKDLYELLAANGNVDSDSFSFFSLPSQSSRVQEFKSSRQEIEEGTLTVTFAHFVAAFVVTKEGTGNRKSFDLARAVITNNPNMSMDDINKIHHEWFTGSQPLLPQDADESRSFQTFLKQLSRVRFTNNSLKAACERARSAPAFVPALDGNIEATKLAALCRELQREAQDRSFICPVGTVQQFLGLRWREQGRWLLRQLELNGVIQCVDRGAPNTPGKKGRSTLWRYKLTADNNL